MNHEPMQFEFIQMFQITCSSLQIEGSLAQDKYIDDHTF